jgi:2-polyprenyl-6-hydroxyphenyl methylase/3-demethylubiquinone-9 3-methyltransferase
MNPAAFLLDSAPYGLLTFQGTLMVVDEAVFHRERVLGRAESWGHVADTLVFVATLSIPAFQPQTTAWLLAYAIGAVFSSVFITKDEWIHTKECRAGEHWVHSLLFVVHPTILIAMGALWTHERNATLRIAAAASSLAFATYQWLYWIGFGRARRSRPNVNNAFYEDLGSQWFDSNDHAIALLRAETGARLEYIREVFSKENLREPARVLDIGCGGGLVASPLAAAGFVVKAIDRSNGALAAARARTPSGLTVTYASGDAYALDEPAETFDAALLLDILEHLEEPGRAIEQAARVLRPGGLLVFHTFNRSWLAWALAIHGMKFVVRDVPDHLHVYRLFIRPPELEQMGRRQGLLLRDIRGIRPRVFHKSFVLSLLRRQLHPEFSFVFGRSAAAGYVGYFAKPLSDQGASP